MFETLEAAGESSWTSFYQAGLSWMFRGLELPVKLRRLDDPQTNRLSFNAAELDNHPRTRTRREGRDPVSTDPVTILGAIVFLAAFAVFAGYLPARRASRMDPLRALRYE